MAEIHKLIYCAFCMRSQDQVKHLVGGSSNVYICEECIKRAYEVIEKYLKDKAK